MAGLKLVEEVEEAKALAAAGYNVTGICKQNRRPINVPFRKLAGAEATTGAPCLATDKSS